MIQLLIDGLSSSGGKEKAKPRKCSSCSGEGWVKKVRQIGRGLVTQDEVECGNCKGIGEVFREKDKCKKCKGERVLEERKMLEVYIPRGSK